jgi:hypothetical protein
VLASSAPWDEGRYIATAATASSATAAISPKTPLLNMVLPPPPFGARRPPEKEPWLLTIARPCPVRERTAVFNRSSGKLQMSPVSRKLGLVLEKTRFSSSDVFELSISG